MDLQLRGKHALVTGASQGIGAACAEALAAEGCAVTLVARDATRLAGVADGIRGSAQVPVRTLAFDLSVEANVAAAAAAAGEVDILVNNAGAIPPGTLASVDSATWRDAWDLKVFGYIALTRAIYAQMAARRAGVVVNIIGSAGETFPPAYIAGAAGNAALMAFTRALGKGAPADGVRVVGINPGPVATPRMEMLQRATAARTLGDAERWPELVAKFPYGRAATAAEIGAAAAFLASPLSGYTNATILTIDGGP
jgi:NAD(P)-dependent dehydrogenase (short-subunit alcohol dehydrogenase family)